VPLKVLSGIGWTLAILLCGVAFGRGVTRQRIDQLQWGVVLRLLGVAAAALCVIGIPSLVRGLATSTGAQDYISLLIIFPLFMALIAPAVLFTAVVGESLATELRPGMVQGVEDLSRGRLAIPEVMSGVTWGYVIGFVAAGANALLDIVLYRVFGAASIPGKVSTIYGSPVPSLYVILMIGGAIIGAFAVLYAVTTFAGWKLTGRVALILPALMTGMMFAATPDMTGASLAMAILVFAFAIWHFGFIAVLIGFWAPDVIKDGISIIASGSGEFLTVGLITLALGIAPLVLAFILYRRYRRAV
jgi:hypothetical protein